MLVCALFAQFAHETAGAARTRHPLLPLHFERDNVDADLGQTVPRERGAMFGKSTDTRCHRPRMRVIQYAAASRLKLRCLWNAGSPAFAGDDERNEFENQNRNLTASLRANGSRECAPDDRLREAIHAAARRKKEWIASVRSQ